MNLGAGTFMPPARISMSEIVPKLGPHMWRKLKIKKESGTEATATVFGNDTSLLWGSSSLEGLTGV